MGVHKERQRDHARLLSYFYLCLVGLLFSCFAVFFLGSLLWMLKSTDPSLLSNILDLPKRKLIPATSAVTVAVSLYSIVGLCSGASMFYCNFALSSFPPPKKSRIDSSSTDESEDSDDEEVMLLENKRK